MDIKEIYKKNRFKVSHVDKKVDFDLETAPQMSPFDSSYVIVTAWNPQNTELSREENDIRNSHLFSTLSRTSYTFDPATGYFDDHYEGSYCIYGMSFEEGIALGETFDQFAIFYRDNKRVGYYEVATKIAVLEIVKKALTMTQIVHGYQKQY